MKNDIANVSQMSRQSATVSDVSSGSLLVGAMTFGYWVLYVGSGWLSGWWLMIVNWCLVGNLWWW